MPQQQQVPLPDVHDDPEFHGLPLAEKHKVLMATDPDYRGMPPSEQAKALDEIHYGQLGRDESQFTGGTRNRIADAIDTGRGAVERTISSGMEASGLPAHRDPDAISKFIGTKTGPSGKSALMDMIDAHAEAGKKSPVGYVPLLGPISVRASEHAQSGQYPEMVGDLAAGVGTAAPFKGPGLKLSDAIGKAAREPGGSLRPAVQGAAELGGTLAGMGAIENHPYVGAGIGYKTLPRLADAIIPERPPAVRKNPFPIDDWVPGDSPLSDKSTGKVSSLKDDITKLPAGSEQGRGPLTPEQVPGRPRLRDIAKSGDPRAGAELQRRGEKVLYTTDPGYSGVREKVDLRDALSDSQEPPEGRPASKKGRNLPTGKGPKGGSAQGQTSPKTARLRDAIDKSNKGLPKRQQGDTMGQEDTGTMGKGNKGNKGGKGNGIKFTDMPEDKWYEEVNKIFDEHGLGETGAMVVNFDDRIIHHQNLDTGEDIPIQRDSPLGEALAPFVSDESFANKIGKFKKLTKKYPDGKDMFGRPREESEALKNLNTNAQSMYGDVYQNLTDEEKKAVDRAFTKPKPSLKSDLAGYKPSEKATEMSGERKSLGKEFEEGERQHQIDRYKSILRNEKATPDDLKEANARLRELGAQTIEGGSSRNPVNKNMQAAYDAIEGWSDDEVINYALDMNLSKDLSKATPARVKREVMKNLTNEQANEIIKGKNVQGLARDMKKKSLMQELEEGSKKGRESDEMEDLIDRQRERIITRNVRKGRKTGPPPEAYAMLDDIPKPSPQHQKVMRSHGWEPANEGGLIWWPKKFPPGERNSKMVIFTSKGNWKIKVTDPNADPSSMGAKTYASGKGHRELDQAIKRLKDDIK